MSWLSRSRRKLRSTRGLSWLALRVKATTVIEKAIPTTETVTVVIASRMLRAACRSAKLNSGTLTPSHRSTSGIAIPTTTPARIASAAGKPKVVRAASTTTATRSRGAIPPATFIDHPLPR